MVILARNESLASGKKFFFNCFYFYLLVVVSNEKEMYLKIGLPWETMEVKGTDKD